MTKAVSQMNDELKPSIRVLIKVIELFVDKVVERVYSYRWIRG